MARIVTTDQAKLFEKGSNTAFMEGWSGYKSQAFELAERIPSTQETENYPFLGAHPKPRQWDGERRHKAVKAYTYAVTNVDYEVTWDLDRKVFLYDQYGVVKRMGTSGGYAMAQYIEELIATQTANSISGLCYDGQIMCSASHPIGDTATVQSNLGSTALSGAAVDATIAAGMLLQDDVGRPLNIIYNKLIVPPALRGTALKIANSPSDPDNANDQYNPNKGLEVIVWPWLTDVNNWFMACTTGYVRPVFWQEVVAPSPVTALSDAISSLKTDKKVSYGSEMTAAAGYGDWRFLYAHVI